MNPDLALDQATSGGADVPTLDARAVELDEVDLARANEYALLASLLLGPPDADLLRRLSGLQDSTDTPLGQAHTALGRAAASASADAVSREYFNLFIGVGRGELLPYASYYLTGFLNERPLARLRGDMKRLGLERAEGHSEPEDHLGTLCEIMSGFAADHFVISAEEEQDFFERHIAPWAAQFFADLENANAASFYSSVGMTGRLFIDIETNGFAMETRRST